MLAITLSGTLRVKAEVATREEVSKQPQSHKTSETKVQATKFTERCNHSRFEGHTNASALSSWRAWKEGREQEEEENDGFIGFTISQ